MSNTIRWICLGALIGTSVIIVTIWSARPKEPRYKDRTLSSWLNEWEGLDFDRTTPAASAVLAIGTNGLPWLLDALSKKESATARNFWHFARTVVPEDWIPRNIIEVHGREAGQAINLLGPLAKTALPVLTNLLTGKQYNFNAAVGLVGIGPEGVVAVLPGLTNRDWKIRSCTAIALSDARSDMDEIIPALISVVETTGNTFEDIVLRRWAGSALVEFHQKPELVVPVFIQLLASPDTKTQMWAIGILGGFGSDAKAAIPYLLDARTNENRYLREAAEKMLKKIDSEAANRAGIK